MPYPTLESLPDAVKGLPKHGQEIWQSAYNSAFDQYDGDEGKAAGTAWAAVKNKYEKTPDGNWVVKEAREMAYETVDSYPEEVKKLPDEARKLWVDVANREIQAGQNVEASEFTAWAETRKLWGQKEGSGEWEKFEMETVNLQDVEIFAVGEWNGAKYSEDDLNDIVNNFNLLKGKHEPFLKLGHEESQGITQKSGLPAIGWIENVKRVGGKLLADISQVPRKIHELIQAGAYKKISSELWHNLKYKGRVYKLALRAVALMGADVPAVWDIGSIAANYSFGKQGCDAVTFELEGTEIKTQNEEEVNEMKELEETKAKLEKAEADLKVERFAREEAEKKAKTEIEERARIETEAEEKDDFAFIEDRLAEGRIIPAQAGNARALFKGIAKSAVVKFMAKDGDKDVEKEIGLKDALKAFIAGSKPQIVLGETGRGTVKVFESLDEAAKHFEKEDKVSYRDAVLKASRLYPSLIEKPKEL